MTWEKHMKQMTRNYGICQSFPYLVFCEFEIGLRQNFQVPQFLIVFSNTLAFPVQNFNTIGLIIDSLNNLKVTESYIMYCNL